MMQRTLLLTALALVARGAVAQESADHPVQKTWEIASPKIQEDYPVLCVDGQGVPWVAYLQHDGKADTLTAAALKGDALEPIGPIAGPGILHQPAVSCDGKGAVWVVWSQLDEEKSAWSLMARRIVDGKVEGDAVTVEGRSGSAVLADAGTDAKGRLWVAWQSFRKAHSDIYARYYTPETGAWSDEIRVTKHEAGDWEPRLAFDGDGGTWIAFDSSRSGVFNVQLAQVSVNGETKITALTGSPRYQGRPSIAAGPDGKGFWLAWENGRVLWGKNSRGVSAGAGLNTDKRVEVVHYDIATGKVTPAADPTGALRSVAPAAKKPDPKQPPRRRRAGGGVQALNLPKVGVDATGNPWIAVRRYVGTSWEIVLSRYDREAKAWSRPARVEKSRFGQDRRIGWATGGGKTWLCWPSDLRTSKKPLVAGVYVARLNPAAAPPASTAKVPPLNEELPPPRWGDDTPERARDDRHVWTVDGKTYTLYWGDFHRHTDISNCRTPHDGCILEHYRYAYDMGGLDFVGTSDHTDIGGMYGPYEWWHSQKMQDVFYAPGFFNSLYVYEREQKWPWGHRNVIFSRRGGPMVYISRARYLASPWSKDLPTDPNEKGGEINPKELWRILRASGRDLSIMSHTGATGMGTDWDLYKQIDHAVENLVEIYQGARVSYEGLNTPQPTVGFPVSGKLKPDAHGSVKTGKDFGKYNKGVYQNALQNGYKLGVFANSDHISTNTSYGGVYVEAFTREGIVAGMNARRTIAATDRIFLHVTCNGKPLGSIFETAAKPSLEIFVSGTAKVKRLTVVRNEKDYKTLAPDGKEIKETFVDENPLNGENRYYVRLVQEDGNMAWSSPVWVTVKGAE